MATDTLALERAEKMLAFHEGSAEPERPGDQPTVRINGKDFAQFLADLRAAIPAHRMMYEALGALTCQPDGHIWHGGNAECTGECKDVRAAIAKAEGRHA